MKISVVVNAYNRTQFIDRAVGSAWGADEIIAVVNFPYTPKTPAVRVVEVEENAVGFRYYTGIQETRGDIILLLDDDDYFQGNKIQLAREKLEHQHFLFVKDRKIRGFTLYDSAESLPSIIKHHLDWDISRTTLGYEWRELLSRYSRNIEYSYDKFLYYVALNEEADIELLASEHGGTDRTVKVKNPDSRMRTLRKQGELRAFYSSTSATFENLRKTVKNDNASAYLEFQSRYNKYLAMGDKEVLGKYVNIVPRVNLLYHDLMHLAGRGRT